jgi:hypothetical protein
MVGRPTTPGVAALRCRAPVGASSLGLGLRLPERREFVDERGRRSGRLQPTPDTTAPMGASSPPRAWVLTLALAIVVAVAAPSTPDLAAQAYRAWLFAHHGFVVWDNAWYGGHHVPGYSLVFPPLAALLGLRVTGVLAATASALLFELTLRPLRLRRAGLGCWAFAVCCVGDLVVGRLTYALGVAVGLGATAALVRGHRYAAIALAAACAATSPIAGLFLAFACGVVGLANRRRDALAAGAAAALGVATMAVAFPEGGSQPFGLGALAVLVGLSAVAAMVVAEKRSLRAGLAGYAVAGVAAFAVATPMGENVSRLGTAFLAPLLLATGPRSGRAGGWLLAAVVVGALGWQCTDVAREATKGDDDPTASAVYYRPLVAHLRADDAGSRRVEVPFTRSHWEATFLARHVPLARGWERQLDRRLDPLFYERGLNAASYRRWLLGNGVGLVAVPDAPMDPAGRRETVLIDRGLPYLNLLWRSPHWRLFSVRSPRPLVTGPGTLVRLGTSSVRVAARRPGWLTLRVHWSPYWRVVGGAACARGGPDGWTHIHAAAPGAIALAARFSVAGLLDRPARC